MIVEASLFTSPLNQQHILYVTIHHCPPFTLPVLNPFSPTPGRGPAVRRLRGSGRDLREAALLRQPRIHRQAGARADLGHHPQHAQRTRTVQGERDERGHIQGDPVSQMSERKIKHAF